MVVLGAPGTLDAVPGPNKFEEEGRRDFGNSIVMGRLKELFSGHNYVQEIINAAHKYNIPPAILMAIANKESGINPYAPMGEKGEIGEFQLLPETVARLQALGIIKDPYDPSQNIEGGAYWLSHKPGPTWQDKIRQYNGSGRAAEAYERDVWNKVIHDPTYQPQSYSPAAGSTHVTVNVAHANATPDEIKRAVRDGIEESNRAAAKRLYARAQGAYA